MSTTSRSSRTSSSKKPSTRKKSIDSTALRSPPSAAFPPSLLSFPLYSPSAMILSPPNHSFAPFSNSPSKAPTPFNSPLTASRLSRVAHSTIDRLKRVETKNSNRRGSIETENSSEFSSVPSVGDSSFLSSLSLATANLSEFLGRQKSELEKLREVKSQKLREFDEAARNSESQMTKIKNAKISSPPTIAHLKRRNSSSESSAVHSSVSDSLISGSAAGSASGSIGALLGAHSELRLESDQLRNRLNSQSFSLQDLTVQVHRLQEENFELRNSLSQAALDAENRIIENRKLENNFSARFNNLQLKYQGEAEENKQKISHLTETNRRLNKELESTTKEFSIYKQQSMVELNELRAQHLNIQSELEFVQHQSQQNSMKSPEPVQNPVLTLELIELRHQKSESDELIQKLSAQIRNLLSREVELSAALQTEESRSAKEIAKFRSEFDSLCQVSESELHQSIHKLNEFQSIFHSLQQEFFTEIQSIRQQAEEEKREFERNISELNEKFEVSESNYKEKLAQIEAENKKSQREIEEKSKIFSEAEAEDQRELIEKYQELLAINQELNKKLSQKSSANKENIGKIREFEEKINFLTREKENQKIQAENEKKLVAQQSANEISALRQQIRDSEAALKSVYSEYKAALESKNSLITAKSTEHSAKLKELDAEWSAKNKTILKENESLRQTIYQERIKSNSLLAHSQAVISMIENSKNADQSQLLAQFQWSLNRIRNEINGIREENNSSSTESGGEKKLHENQNGKENEKLNENSTIQATPNNSSNGFQPFYISISPFQQPQVHSTAESQNFPSPFATPATQRSAAPNFQSNNFQNSMPIPVPTTNPSSVFPSFAFPPPSSFSSSLPYAASLMNLSPFPQTQPRF